MGASHPQNGHSQMNSRAKGSRTMHKARRYALSFPGTQFWPWYQPPRWATAQPFDVLLVAPNRWPKFVEIRTNQWRTGNASTKALAAMPGEGYHKQVWMFRNGETCPQIRAWDDTTKSWVSMDDPWHTVAGVED